MALEPQMIMEGRAKTPQFKANGVVISSKLIDDSNECLHTYESILKTSAAEEIPFQYSVNTNGDCMIDAIYDYLSRDPFEKGSKLELSLTQEEPFRMVSYEQTGFEKIESEIPYVTYSLIGIFMVAVFIGLGIFLKKVKI